MKDIRAIIMDVDSTITTIEGIDWLAGRRGAEVTSFVSGLTDLAMSGKATLEEVFSRRLDAVRPSRADVDQLADAYLGSISTGAAEVIGALKAAGIRPVMVSGGILNAVLPLAKHLGVPDADVHAVELLFDSAGEFVRHDATSPLTRQHGKRTVAETLALPRRIAAVGDGMTDLEMRPAVDWFIAFTGVVTRAEVVRSADASVASFHELQELVLG